MSASPRLTPPPWAAWLAVRMALYQTEFLWADDLAEEFRLKAGAEGIRRARLWYRGQVFRSLPAYILNLFRWSATMLKSYLLTAFRNVRKHKVFTFINVVGLSLGLAGSLLILMHIRSELSYDRFHRNAQNIYRVIMDQRWNNWQGRSLWNISPGALAPAAETGVPGIARAARSVYRSSLVTVGETALNENGFWYADPAFLDIFDFPLVSGDRTTALNEPYSVLITRDTSRKYFGSDDPIGRMIRGTPIIGVVKDFHFRSLKREIEPMALALYEPGDIQYFSVKLSGEGLEKTLSALTDAWKKLSPGYPFVYSFLDERLARLYSSERVLLKTFNLFAGLAIILSALGLFGLALFTAGKRTREIGIRKVLGASVPSILSLLSASYLRWILLANVLACPLALVFMKQWLQGFAYRASLPIWIFLAAAGLSLAIALFSVGVQSWRAARTNPAASLRHE